VLLAALDWSPDQQATFFAEVLGFLSRDTAVHPGFNPGVAERKVASSKQRLEQMYDGIARTRLRARYSDQYGVRSPTLLSVMSGRLLDRLVAHARRPRELPFQASMPMAELRVLCWLLVETEKLSAEPFADLPVPAPAEVARSIVMLYLAELDREYSEAVPGKIDVVTWHARPSGIEQLPWAKVFSALEHDGLQALLTAVDFEGRNRQIPAPRTGVLSTPMKEPEDAKIWAQENLRLAWREKLRLHLRVLLAAQEKLPESSTRIAIERRIAELLACHAREDFARGTLDMFERDIGEVERDHPAALAEQAAAAMNRFSDETRKNSAQMWIQSTTDPLILLTLSGGLTAAPLSRMARERMSGLTTQALLGREPYLLGYADLAKAAALAGKLEFADESLKRGDDICAGRPAAQARWQEESFQARLLLAYRRKDSGAMRDLALPAVNNTLGVVTQEHVTALERARNFYLALLQIETHPRDAVKAFEEMIRERPDAPELKTNRFAAHLHAADLVPDADARRGAFAEALRVWREFPVVSQDLNDQNVITFNLLIAFDELGYDADFDAALASASTEFCNRFEVARRAVRNLVRRGLIVRAEALVDRLRNYHAAGEGTLPPEVHEIAKELTDRATRALAQAEVASAPELTDDDHRNRFAEIIRLPAKRLSRAVGLSGASSLTDFLLLALFDGVKELLKRGSSLGTIHIENKRNDLLQSMLRMRFALIGWHIPDQSRGGASLTSSQSASAGVGERNFVVEDDSGEIAIVEALRLDSVSTAEIDEHLQKLSGYDQAGLEQAYVIVYYEGQNFEAFVQRYAAHVSTVVIAGSELKSHGPYLPEGAMSATNVSTLRFNYVAGRNRLIVVDHLLTNVGPPSPLS